jgi:hypothetical protein
VTGVAAAGRFLDWGVVQISLANLLVVAIMVAAFALAVLVPFPGRQDEAATDGNPGEPANPGEPGEPGGPRRPGEPRDAVEPDRRPGAPNGSRR